ncbi:MAG: universal stress protein [Deltaproteobacteria bacterium]|nr:universal stress protein [Deltaproteobacteria bacterium]
MFTNILVPLDGSERSERVLPPARAVVEALHIDVELLQTIDPDVLTAFSDPERGRYVDQVSESMRNNSINYLEKVANSFPDPPRVTCSAKIGKAAEVITDLAADDPGTLIAMSTHGRSSVQRWLLGSTADKVLHAARNPLLLVRATDKTPLSETPLLRKIIVPLDGSKMAELTLPHVVTLAKGLGLEVLMVRVLDELALGQPPYVEYIFEKMRSEAKTYLEMKAGELQGQGLANVSYLILWGNPAAKIIDIIQATHDNLVAICTHCRSGIGRWVLGSVTDRIVHYSDNPVLVVRSSH